MCKHYFVFNHKSVLKPVFGTVLVIFATEILAPEIITYFCNYGYTRDNYVCMLDVDEPIRREYESFYTTSQSTVTTSGTVTPSVSPSPSPEFS